MKEDNMENGIIPNRQTKAIETKKKIYEAADELFKKYGFDHVSVDTIVEMAGVSKGSFYVHFESKNFLIVALMAEAVDQLDLGYKSHVESFPSDTLASDILISLAGKIADDINYTVGYDVMKFLYEVQLTRSVNTEVVSGYNRNLYKIFIDIISLGVRQSEFKTDISVDSIAKHYVMAIRGLTYEWCIRYPDFSLKDHAKEHFKILLSGIKK